MHTINLNTSFQTPCIFVKVNPPVEDRSASRRVEKYANKGEREETIEIYEEINGEQINEWTEKGE